MVNKKKSVKHNLTWQKKLEWLGKWVGLPLLIYFILFCILTWPWMANFNDKFFTDAGDGLQNVWNIWWIQHSVTNLSQLPWHTNFLHHPFGVTLIGQTLNPFNGFFVLGLLPIISLQQAYNLMVVFSFVVGGLTAFWLCYYFARSYVASMIGGAIFTFSSYHFAHAQGHMQLVSLEWIPLFILLWWMFVKKPTYWLATGSAISLMLVLFCDYYYFLYSLMVALGIVMYFWYKKKLPNLKDIKVIKKIGLFIGLCVLLVAPLPIALLVANSQMEFTGSHPATVFSSDLFGPFINSGYWKFHALTDGYYSHIDANSSESTNYLGLSVIFVILVSFIYRKIYTVDLLFWQILGIVFAILSLGPRLMVFGHTFEQIRMPYVILERIIPGMKLSGMPIRMMVIVILSSAVVVAIVLSKIDLSQHKGKLLLILFSVVFAFEVVPTPLPLTSTNYPNYVKKLQTLPSTGGVLDEAASSEPLQLYYQTYHEKPIAFGYVSRLPKELNTKEFNLYAYSSQNKLDLICSEYKVRYLTAPASRPRETTFPIIYQDKEAIIYDLKNSVNC